MDNNTYDFLVIGSGLAGLSFALKVADKGKVCIITKTTLEHTNTSYAQGGIAAVIDKSDDFEKHIHDTLVCGDGICNEEIVRMVVREAPEAINQLVSWGTQFDRDEKGNFELAREGGHSDNRILHHQDNSGFEIQRALSDKVRKHKNITILENHFAIDLITQHHLGILVKRYFTNIECYGAYVLNLKTNEIKTILARATLIATGGLGNVYHTTTNPVIATGDGVAMVYRAKGIVEDMEFVQFHPTALYHPGERPAFLITEAMRGSGAVLRTQDGNEFMQKYDSRGSLAPRDIVARAIDNELKVSGHDFVYLDCRHIKEDELLHHFPNIIEKCKSIGIDIVRDMIPVAPAAHFSCGGIKVNGDGCSWINRLYGAGEVTCTGLHGANRLASNSLLEAIVFATRAANHALAHFDKYHIPANIPRWNAEGTSDPEEMVLITQSVKELQLLMNHYVGIVRSDLRLERAEHRVDIIFFETEELYKKLKLSQALGELRNLINTSYLIVKAAQQRKESVGLHYNIDYPHRK